MKPEPIPSSRISEFMLSHAGISSNTTSLPDSLYLCPSRAWLLSTFRKSWAKLLSNLNLWTYSPEDNDCDDFARFCHSYARILHRKTSGRPKGTGFAFGTFWYTTRTGVGHVINCAITADKNNNPEILFFEPQNGQELHLTESELASCADYQF